MISTEESAHPNSSVQNIGYIHAHCIQTWAKTQATVAKASAESELYAVVRGCTEGLRLITMSQHFVVYFFG